VIAAVFASAMGSLSAAMNALATAYTRDFRQGYFHGATTNKASLHAARGSTLVFAALLAAVACGTATFVVYNPDARIIPIVLGIFGYSYGAILGVFLLGMLTKRGTDRGNLIAMGASIVIVLVASGLPGIHYPAWFPLIAFPWRILLGTSLTVAIGLCFRD
jgi:Na+/proline symporter